MRKLYERHVSFDYDYSMHCASCGEATFLSAQDYADEINEAHVDCDFCGEDIHFGRAVAALRDLADPSLADESVGQLAWYHTTTLDGWPRQIRPPMHRAHIFSNMPADVVERMQATYADQALHVGTYEAAIESMLHRMRDQDDADKQFYLCRVALRPDLTVEPDFRNENEAEAAQITQTQIRSARVLAVRYLNVHEAMGSISLAVRREAIECVQAIPIPIPGVAVRVPEDLAAVTEFPQATRPPRPGPPTRLDELRAARLRRIGDPASPVGAPISTETRERITRSLLTGVSARVREEVEGAMWRWEASQSNLGAALLIERWAQVAALISHPTAVLDRLSAEQPA